MKWHIDSGHAWLQVSLEAVINSGIAHKISGFSYMRGAYVYLEEDCDAYLYLNTVSTPPAERSELECKYYKGDAPCRKFNHWPAHLFKKGAE
jgi:hypothetical protein